MQPDLNCRFPLEMVCCGCYLCRVNPKTVCPYVNGGCLHLDFQQKASVRAPS